MEEKTIIYIGLISILCLFAIAFIYDTAIGIITLSGLIPALIGSLK